MSRTFEDKPATRERVPLWVGVYGPTGTGKTFSALRLATGIQRVTGGELYFADTEGRRGLHYADKFKFRHIHFAPPFGPLDYLACAEHAVSKGARVLAIDSGSHSHEGQGGVLEMHAAELDRLSGRKPADDADDDAIRAYESKRKRQNFSAWVKPKADHRKMIAGLMQLPINIVWCFRAKEKLKIQPGKDPVDLGWMPIAADELTYEMTMMALLPPGACGVPLWQGKEAGERLLIKLPLQFVELFKEKSAMSEEHGEALATWAAGTAADRGPPKFGKKLAPEGWADRPLADAPGDVLLAYRMDVAGAAAAATGKAAQQWQGHLASVDAVLAVAPAVAAESATPAAQAQVSQ